MTLLRGSPAPGARFVAGRRSAAQWTGASAAAQMHPQQAANGTFAKWPALLIILGFALVVARLHEIYPPLSRAKPVLSLVLVATFATLSVRRAPGEQLIPFEDRSLILVILYWLWMFATIPTALFRGLSTQMAIDHAPIILFTVLIISQRPSVKQLSWITNGFLLMCGSYGILMLLFGKPLNDNDGVRYYLNDSLDSNDAAALLAMGAPMAWAAALRAKRQIWKLFCWALFAILCAATLRTASRGGAIALAAGVTLVVISGRGLRGAMMMFGAVGMLAVAWQFMPKGLSDRLAIMGDASQDYNRTSYDGRVMIWKRGIKYFTENPVFGVGVGNFSTREGEQMKEDGRTGKWSAAHNSYIQAFAELGFAGGALFCLILAVTIRRASQFFRTPSPVTGQSHPEYVASLGAFAVSGIFLSHAYFWGFYALVGLCALAARGLGGSSAQMSRGRAAASAGRAPARR